MTNTYGSLLIAILTASSACLASTQSQSSVAIITGEIQSPTSREITFGYESPSALEDSEERVVLDSLNRFSFELPVVRGTLVRAYYNEVRSMFFVEPSDSLHVVVEEGFSDSSYSFSGTGADNNRFVVEWMAEFGRPRLDYEGLEAEDFKRQVDQRRRDQFEFLAARSKEYALSLGFVDYAIAHFNYEWANLMISYPTEYRFANGEDNSDLPPKYYDFLQEIPLVDEKAIGTMDYHTFLVRTLDWERREQIEQAFLFRSGSIGRPPRDRGELDKMSNPFRRPNLSEMYNLSDLELSEETVAQLDALYEKEGRGFKLSQMVDLSAVGLLSAAQVRLDSMYEKKRRPKLSQSFDLSVFGLSETDQARIDALFEKSKSYSFFTSSEVEEASVDTTGGSVAFYLPLEIKQDSLKKEPPKLSEKLNLSWLSEPARAQLDSMYEHPQRPKLSERIDLSSLDLSGAVQAQLDSMTTTTGPVTLKTWSSFSARYGQAKEKLEGRVLYWFLAGEVIRGFKRGSDAFELAQHMWEEFQEINPYPEYTEVVQAALHKALKLQPGQPAPEFTLYDLDGQPVSLSQFKGQVVLLDFWASWCVPCIGDLPDLRRIKKKAADKPLVFLNLSLDTDEAAWREAIDKHEIEGVHVRADGWGADVAKSYQVNSLPSYYLVDSQGLIVERLRILRNTDEIVATIEKSL
ncbi:MAG: TlpA disulfide reductase family protein [Gemmatimonadota bacterium]|nr:TlpA disulfide reductase family protein [Gemmatimonadota bacterium]